MTYQSYRRCFIPKHLTKCVVCFGFFMVSFCHWLQCPPSQFPASERLKSRALPSPPQSTVWCTVKSVPYDTPANPILPDWWLGNGREAEAGVTVDPWTVCSKNHLCHLIWRPSVSWDSFEAQQNRAEGEQIAPFWGVPGAPPPRG